MDSKEKRNPMEIRSKIISLVKIRGPSLPVHLAGEVGLDMLFTSAFLSEIASDKTIKISSMKVGGSPLYFLPGQEARLENFYQHLPGKEKEAFLFLKEKKVLQDSKQEPAIRVALRNLKDFALPMLIDTSEGKILFWKFHSVTNQEVESLLIPAKPVLTVTPKPEIMPTAKPEKLVAKPEKPVLPAIQKPEIKPARAKPEKIIKATSIRAKPEKTREPAIKERQLLTAQKQIIKEQQLLTIKTAEKEEIKQPFKQPLLIIKSAEKTKPPKQKSEFVASIIEFLAGNNMEILEEKEAKKKDYQAVIKISSDLGKISFLCIAKDKKKITENDLTLALQKSQALKITAFLISTGELDKKALSYLEQYSSLIKFMKI